MFKQQNDVYLEDEIDEMDSFEDGPTEEELKEYAETIGIDPETEPELLWIARAGITAPLPSNEWKAVESENGSLYFFNFRTGESSWEHPSDEKYRNMVDEERKKLDLRNKIAVPKSKVNEKPLPNKSPAVQQKVKKKDGVPPNTLNPVSATTGGRLTPLGSIGDKEEKPKAGRLTPLGGPSANKPQANGSTPNRKSAPIGLGLSTSKDDSSRPKTSRGARQNLPEREAVSPAPLLQGGGLKFLKGSNENKEISKPSEPEILTLSPRELMAYDIEKSSTDDESFAQISASNFPVIDAAALEPISNMVESKKQVMKPATSNRQSAKLSIEPKIPPKPKSPIPEQPVKSPPVVSNEKKVVKVEEKQKKEEEIIKQIIKENTKMENKNKEDPKMENKNKEDTKMENKNKEMIKEDSKLEELKKEHESKMKVLKDEIEKEKRKTEIEVAAEKRRLEGEKEKRVKEMNEKHESELKTSLEEAKTKNEQQIQQQLEKLEKERNLDFDNEKQRISDKYERELSDLKAEYEAKIAKSRRELKTKLTKEESVSELGSSVSKSKKMVNRFCQTTQLKSRSQTSQTIPLPDPKQENSSDSERSESIQVREKMDKLTDLVLSLQSQLDIVAENTTKSLQEQAKLPNLVQPPQTPPLATSSPKPIWEIGSLDDLSFSNASSKAKEKNCGKSEDVVKKAKEYLQKQTASEQQARDSGFDRSALSETPAMFNTDPNAPLAEVIHSSLMQIQSDLKVLSGRLTATHTSNVLNRPPSHTSHFQTVLQPENLDSYLDKKWENFVKNSYTTFTPTTSLSHNESFDGQLANLKEWLREFESKIAKH